MKSVGQGKEQRRLLRRLRLPTSRPQLPATLVATVKTDLNRLRSLRLRAMAVAVGVGFAPIFLVWAATGFDTSSEEVFRLFMAVMPVAIVVGWWLGWRMVRPVELLTNAALNRALDASPEAGFDLGRTDEFGALAIALDTLVSRLEQQNQANVGFVADLAHELKNPLAAIRVVGERLSADPEDVRQARMARILERSTARLDALVSELLELARTESGLHGEGWQHVDLSALATGVVDTIAGDPRYEAVTFEVNAETAVTVLGVPGRIETALRNLIDNAASFNVPGESGPAGGRVWVDVIAEGGRAVVRVCDTGPGISADDLPKVFDRFFTTRSGDRKGTGLGLALVSAVARAHRGEATVTSDPGVETCFTLRLWAENSQ
ncbi:MAG: HAMP domain-containing histidine kinase [Myxococcales bacterium]|nr:HAMP domain-containing histidine kinase [Myxococcales bacterium]